jgi:hypothetical protein
VRAPHQFRAEAAEPLEFLDHAIRTLARAGWGGKRRGEAQSSSSAPEAPRRITIPGFII